jgi:hypothetical protein
VEKKKGLVRESFVGGDVTMIYEATCHILTPTGVRRP